MLRRRDFLINTALRMPVILLLSLGIGLPLLTGAGLMHLAPRYMGISAGIALAVCVFSLRKKLLPAVFLVFLLSQAALYPFHTGLFRQTADCFRILKIWLGDAAVAPALYGDVLCLHLSLLVTLLCCVFSLPGNGLYAPLFCISAILIGEWMLGLHDCSRQMMLVLPALTLQFAITHRYEHQEHEKTPHAVSPAVLPLAALLLALSLLLAPPEGTTVQPLAELAQKIRDSIDDHFFYTEKRTRYTLASDGWMPQGQMQLGGEPQPSNREVMDVQTEELTYLRGAILDTYTGGVWYDSVSTRRYGWNASHYRTIRNELFQAAYPLVSGQTEKELHVTLLNGNASTVFLPQRIRSLQPGDNMVAYFNTGTEVFITRDLAAGDSYTVRYLPMKATDSGMAALCALNAQVTDPLFESARTQYTHLPGHIQQEVYDIAAKATNGLTTPWEKAVALRDYLKSHYDYSLNVKTPPADVDFVAWFLLAEQKGYCTYFASAMTVLCRIAGLPARYVEGYIAKPDESGVAHVTGLDAHAWTEVYFNGLGWVTFDATASVSEPDRSHETAPPAADRQTPTPEPAATQTPRPDTQNTPTPPPAPEAQSTPTPTPMPDEAPNNDRQNDPEDSLPWLWLLLLIALFVLLAWRIRTTHPLLRAQNAKDDTRAMMILWQATLECAAALGLGMQPAETPLQYAARMESEWGAALHPVAEAVSAYRYGRHNASGEALSQMRSIYLSLEEQLSLRSKLMLALRRAFSRR